ncbi:MAG: flagellar hook-basal body complex protein [Acidobacteriota bacterium]
MAFSSFFAGLSGLQAHASKLSVIGNNLSNVNTIGFKSSRSVFSDLFAQASSGAGVNGAGNPMQVGLGVLTGSIDRLFSQGSLQTTSLVTDMAIQGNGFFVVQDPTNARAFTRAGNFTFDRNGNLVTSAGQFVQGFTTRNAAGNITSTGAVSNINVPAGQTAPPQATTFVRPVSNLAADAAVGDTFSTTVSVFDSLGAQHDVTATFTSLGDINADNIPDWDMQVTVPGADVIGGTPGTPFTLGSATLSFDSSGNLVSPANLSLATPAWANGAAAQTFTWELFDPSGAAAMTRFDGPSATSSISQDGASVGQLRALTVDSDGLMTGIFSNGRTLELAKLALATFNNPNGLLGQGANSFVETNASGPATVGGARSGGRGTITSNAVELSNADITQEFTDLIITQRGYQANSRIITTTDQVIQEALNLKRAVPGPAPAVALAGAGTSRFPPGVTGDMMTDTAKTPLISVIIPTYNRIPQLVQLLHGLAGQTFDAGQFEVIVSDDGSTDPVAAAVEACNVPFPLTLLTQENAGPAAARNRAIERARGRLTLILNDDAVVAPDLLQTHLLAHTRRNVPVAVLGSFGFVDAALTRPFVRLMEESDLLFDFVSMVPGKTHGWRYFWTCNLSLPTRALFAVGGFDEDFREPICEDIELGYRLAEIDIPVLYRPQAACRHDHDIDPARYARRQRSLGRNVFRLCTKHADPRMSRVWGIRSLDDAAIASIARLTEAEAAAADAALARLTVLDGMELPADAARQRALLDEMARHTRALSSHRFRQGLVEGWREQHGSGVVFPAGVTQVQDDDPGCMVTGDGCFTSIVIPCINGLTHTIACLDSIAVHTPEPHEVIVVDNGSDAQTLAALRGRAGIHLIEMGRNIGAPAARNHAMVAARGDPLIFLDNDTRVTPDWLDRLAAHTRNNPRVGLVGPMSNTVSGSQKIDDATYDPDRLDAFAVDLSSRCRGRHHYTRRLILFAMLVRRKVIDTIGGFDPIYGCWGFEDDDFCLRAALAGFRLRVAEDVFIHHTGSQTSVAARLDYDHLLRTNWEVFKKKWALDEGLAYGSPYPLDEILQRRFEARRHQVPLPESAAALDRSGDDSQQAMMPDLS